MKCKNIEKNDISPSLLLSGQFAHVEKADLVNAAEYPRPTQHHPQQISDKKRRKSTYSILSQQEGLRLTMPGRVTSLSPVAVRIIHPTDRQHQPIPRSCTSALSGAHLDVEMASIAELLAVSHTAPSVIGSAGREL